MHGIPGKYLLLSPVQDSTNGTVGDKIQYKQKKEEIGYLDQQCVIDIQHYVL